MKQKKKNSKTIKKHHNSPIAAITINGERKKQQEWAGRPQNPRNLQATLQAFSVFTYTFTYILVGNGHGHVDFVSHIVGSNSRQ